MVRKELFKLRPLPQYRDRHSTKKEESTFCNMDPKEEEEVIFDARKGDSPAARSRIKGK